MTPPVGDGWWTEADGEIKPGDAHLSRMTAEGAHRGLAGASPCPAAGAPHETDRPTEERAMTPLGRILFVTLGLAVLIGGMLALRSEPEPVVVRAALTPAQVAELQQPAAKPVDPPKKAPDAGDQALPPEPEIEDGSGS